LEDARKPAHRFDFVARRIRGVDAEVLASVADGVVLQLGEIDRLLCGRRSRAEGEAADRDDER
jgi:hypothetical protein